MDFSHKILFIVFSVAFLIMMLIVIFLLYDIRGIHQMTESKVISIDKIVQDINTNCWAE